VYDRLWAAAQDLDVPLSMHVATDRADPRAPATSFVLDIKHVPPSAFVNKDYQVRHAMAELVLTGVLERFPRLRVGSVEHELAWIPFFLEQMDYTYTDRPPRGDWYRFKDPGALPSDFFRRASFASFQEDAVGLRIRDAIGVETLMWGSDYPHTESTFPKSREILGRILADVPGDEVRQIVATNAATLYGFDLPASAPPAPPAEA
jgi:predicted TIM-barrel fold metal-dependent hydrolase